MIDENAFDENKKETVYLKKEPSAIAMRIFKENEDYETQVIRECDVFFAKYNLYPNAIVMNSVTFDRWFGSVENSALESEVDDYLENITFEQIKKASQKIEDENGNRILDPEKYHKYFGEDEEDEWVDTDGWKDDSLYEDED